MITLAVMLLALMGQQEQTDTEGRSLVRTYTQPRNGTGRCLRNLPPDRQVSVQLTCRVNGIGGPTACTFAPETTQEQRYASECVARGYRFTRPDGSSAAGLWVRFNVRLITL